MLPSRFLVPLCVGLVVAAIALCARGMQPALRRHLEPDSFMVVVFALGGLIVVTGAFATKLHSALVARQRILVTVGGVLMVGAAFAWMFLVLAGMFGD